MFSKNNIKIIKYGEIPTRLQRARAYRVRISYEDKDKIFDSILWPKGEAMSKFFTKEDSDKYYNMNNKIQPKSSSSPKVNTRKDVNILSKMLNIVSLNTNGARGNLLYIEYLIKNNDIMFCCEYWLSKYENNFFENINLN
jgi:hypothetical protein